MRLLERLLIVLALIVFAALTVWTQFEQDTPAERPVTDTGRRDPDYYIENFTTTGMDETGQRRYTLKAERLVHYPDDNTALLDKPHLIQYPAGQAPTHTYAESGWVSSDGEEVLLVGNVRVIRGAQAGDPGGVATSDRMRVLLKKGTLKKER